MEQVVRHTIVQPQQKVQPILPVHQTSIPEADNQAPHHKIATNLKVALLTNLQVQDLALQRELVQIRDHRTVVIRTQDQARAQVQHTEQQHEAVPVVPILVEAAGHQEVPIPEEVADHPAVLIQVEAADHPAVLDHPDLEADQQHEVQEGNPFI